MVDRRGREGGINARPCASYTVDGWILRASSLHLCLQVHIVSLETAIWVKTLAVTRNLDFGLVWFATGS